MINLFIDTNILLHFKTFDEIKWAKIVNDDIQLVIAPIVLDEIDKHKNHHNPKTARRAKMIADKFELYLDGLQDKINLAFVAKRPTANYFEAHQLDPKHQDDCLLASILQYKDEHPSEPIQLVTDDLGAKMRAATLQIQTIKLTVDLRLPEQPDEQVKQIEKLKTEVALLKDRIPKIKLCFEGKQQVSKHKVITPTKTVETYRSAELLKIKAETPFIPIAKNIPEDNSLAGMMQKITGTILSNERIKTYNDSVDQFYKEYQSYFEQYYDHMVQHLHLVELVFELINEGNTPAIDIDVWIHLPNGFEVVNNYPKKPKKPRAPYRPKSNFDYEPLNNSFMGLDFSLPGVRSSAPDPDVPTIKKTNSYEITFHCKSVKHAMTHPFNRVILKYASLADMKSFQIDYRLNAANVPAPVEGTLNVVFE
jgi:rRNA-processing protein FCF1